MKKNGGETVYVLIRNCEKQ